MDCVQDCAIIIYCVFSYCIVYTTPLPTVYPRRTRRLIFAVNFQDTYDNIYIPYTYFTGIADRLNAFVELQTIIIILFLTKLQSARE